MSFLKEYTLLGELGSGGFAKVYKVRHNELGYIRAIRVLNEPITDENSRTYQKFLRECKVLLRLGNGSQSNIVHIYQPRLLENHALVEMDYVDGKDIAHYLQDNGNFLPIDEVLRMAKEMSSALAYCHEDIYKFCMDPDEDNLETDPLDGSKWLVDDATKKRLIEKYKVIHNDIHSGNIMRREDGSFVLLDFGLAITGDDDVRNSSRHENGAMEFKAPEKWDNEALLTEQSDIYSFGIVMYEYLAGRVPFVYDKTYSSAEATYKLSKQHKEQQPPRIYDLRKSYHEAKYPGKTYEKDYPDWLEEAVLKCLEKDPANRFKNGKELYDYIITHIANDAVARNEALMQQAVDKALDGLVAEQSVEHPVHGNPRKKVWPWIVVAGIALVAILGFLLYMPSEKNSVSSEQLSWEHPYVDSIEMLLKENEELYREVSIKPYDCGKIQPFDIISYEKWLPTMQKISDNFWSAHWLPYTCNDTLSAGVYDYYNNRNEYLWSIGYDFMCELHKKEFDYYEKATDSIAKRECEKRMELLEQCGLLYPE